MMTQPGTMMNLLLWKRGMKILFREFPISMGLVPETLLLQKKHFFVLVPQLPFCEVVQCKKKLIDGKF
jgi:hypothetical protein